ncbi:MAG TPA: adenylate/guanylate cyclase domain-containing protein [Conexivisphaerales archaeon]|nr:adenylate/guanylate cyclase domain-containing protein [Conexivisphaerales archaeon]
MLDGERRLAAIMLTDIVGFTSMGQADEGLMLERLRGHRDQLRSIFPRYNGREVKTIGDAFLVVFPSALEAVRCAVSIQETMHEVNSSLPEAQRMQIRVGVHLGDVVQTQGDILGDAVNVSSRIEPLAEPGGICISEQVYDHVRNKIELPIERLEDRKLKNVKVPIGVYRVVMPWEASGARGSGLDTRRIAVLPLLNISQDPRDEYFADGLTEELISTVSSIRELSVISQTSVMGYKGAKKKVGDIGKELDVGSVVEGSVRMAGTRLRVTVQLIDVETDRHLWAQSYDRNLDDVFAIQSDIAQRIAATLKVKLVEGEKASLKKEPTKSMPAYESYLRGLYLCQVGTWPAMQDAVRDFEDAIRLDPEFSSAYAQLGNLCVAMAGETMPLREGFEKAEPLIAKALELDENCADAHLARGNILFQRDLDWTLAEEEFRKAIELNPSSSIAHFWYAVLFFLLGNWESALKEATKARELDPLSLFAQQGVSYVHLLSGDFAKAASVAADTVRLQPDLATTRLWLAYAYYYAGMRGDASKQLDEALRLKIIPHDLSFLARIYALLGRTDEARGVLKEAEAVKATQYYPPTQMAAAYVTLGEKEKALALMEEEFEEDPSSFLFNFRFPDFDPIRNDPRFLSLQARLKLPA